MLSPTVIIFPGIKYLKVIGVSEHIYQVSSKPCLCVIVRVNTCIELQEDVKGFINEIDSLAREDEHVDEDDEMLVIGDSSKVESVMKRSNQATCLANKINIGTEILALSNRPHEGEHKLDKELLHVTFQEPYSTIYYDPESPVVERDVVEIMEYDDEAKDIEGEKEKESIDNDDPFRNIDSDSDSIDEESDSSGEFSYSPPVAESLYPTKGTTSTMDTCVSGPTWDTDMNNLNNDKNEQSLEGNGIELINVNVLKDIVDTENNANADNYSLVTEQESAVTELKVENLKPERDSRFEAVEELGMPVDQLADLQPENKHGDADEGIEEKEISVEHKDVENIGINDKRDSKPIEITDDHTLNDDEPLLTLRRSDSDSERESVDSMIIHDVDNLSTTDNNDSSEFETHLENEESNETQDSNAISALIVDDHGAEIDLDQLKTDVHGLAQEVESVENDLHLDKDSVPIAETVATTEKNAEATLIFDKRDVDVEDLTENKLDGNESDVMSDLNEIENNIGDSGNENSIADEVKDSFKMKVEDILEIPVGESTGTAVGDDIPTTTTEESDVIDEEKEADKGSTEERLSEKEKRMSVILHQYAVKVLELIYWRDVKKTGVVFGSMMFVLVSLACCTLLSVLAYLSLAVLTVTFSFRVYKNVMQAVQKTNDGHPFKKLLETDIELREEVISCAAENIAKHVNSCHLELRRLYLVVDYIDSIKFGMLLWLLTYIGSWFNGITLVMLAVVSIFTLPKVYETYKVPIDSQVNMVRGHLNKVMTQITAKIPFPKKKPKTQ